ncbi:beta-galactosidase GalA [Clostridium grantii]|uniref:Beta-galactosidase n=1 Tax=Clostridium grantii DSM 8605 TaxID=1121316 RepID=A0A1M5SYA8_9CLOT|nr:beta-galactosidase GalA [Clostridium grantii]SHH43340.1 beta-galactosidase [Clostridium grantii DSM 8605]
MREIYSMNYDWKFYDGDIQDRSFDCTHGNVSKNPSWMKSGNNGVAKWGYPDLDWQDIDLPHDFVCERGEFSETASASQGSLVKGIVWYRKTFELKKEDSEKCVTIEFDGIFRNYEVWLNGHLLGMEISGYKSVSYNIDDVCSYEDVNVIAIRVDATDCEGWWYEGGGIYRNVRLVKTSKLHVGQWGTFVKYTVLEESKAEVVCDTTIYNEYDKVMVFDLVTQIINQAGEVVEEIRNINSIKPHSQLVVMNCINMDKTILWDIEDPYLYKLNTLIKKDNEIMDCYETKFGIRTVHFDNETGFYLNGKNIKLKGVCCHEDHAGVGVAVPDALHEYRIKLLKEMGCNAYRTSHNPPTPALLDACDKLGMLVMDETRVMDTSEEYVQQLKTLIKRDRNHPSVILWSLGNEEMNIHGTDVGIRIYKRLIRIAKSLDPTRKTTYAMNCNWYDISEFNESHNFSVEVGGLNYNLMRNFNKYDTLHEKYPEMVLVGTENASTLSTRGLYCEEPSSNDASITFKSSHECIFEKAQRNQIVSGYGEVYPPWGSTPMETWTSVDTRDFMAGVFIWTGFDYRGETIPYRWPFTVSHFGIMDLCGFPKDIYYYYKSWWTNEDTLHIFPHWNWEGKEKELIDVCVFSNMDCVELFLNDKSLGIKEITKAVKATWQVPYEAGTLKAVGYKGEEVIMVKEVKTTKKASKIGITSNKSELLANKNDVCIINIEALDEDGYFVQTSNELLEFSIKGEGKIIGTGNGNPMSHEQDKLLQRKLYHGLCQVIVQSNFQTGDIILTVEGKDFEQTQIQLKSIETNEFKYVGKVSKDIALAKIIGRRDAADGLV